MTSTRWPVSIVRLRWNHGEDGNSFHKMHRAVSDFGSFFRTCSFVAVLQDGSWHVMQR